MGGCYCDIENDDRQKKITWIHSRELQIEMSSVRQPSVIDPLVPLFRIIDKDYKAIVNTNKKTPLPRTG